MSEQVVTQRSKPLKESGAAGAEAATECRAMVSAIDEAEQGIAQELHDTVCQSLSGVRLSAAALRRKLAGVGAGVAEEFVRLEETAGKAVGDLHELVRSLQPAQTSRAELTFSLENLVRESRGQIKAEIRSEGRPYVQDDFAAGQVLKIAQLAIRHASAHAPGAVLAFLWKEEGARAVLTISADRPLFAANDRDLAQTLAWKLAQRRAVAVQGTLEFGQGDSVLTLALPSHEPGAK